MRTARLKRGHGTIQKDVMRMKGLSHFSKNVYCLLISYAGENDTCFPSIATICEDLELSKPTVIKAIKELETKSLVIVCKVQSKNGYKNNVYEPLHLFEEVGLVNEVYPGSKCGLPSLVNDVYPKNIVSSISFKNNIKEEVSTQVVPTSASDPLKESPIDPVKFIEAFNKLAGRKFRATTQVKAALKARHKDYTKNEIYKAIVNAHKDPYHVETKFFYLTPEFILRPGKLEKFLNAPAAANQQESGSSEVYVPAQRGIDHSNR